MLVREIIGFSLPHPKKLLDKSFHILIMLMGLTKINSINIMKSTRKQQLHDQVREEIKSTAWKQIAESSASALSLSAIARSMGLTTPALYRYFPSRDDLVTALIKDAYTSFTTALEAARDALPPHDHLGRIHALCLAYHAWTASNPQPYILIFGAPIPGYKLDPAAGQAADRSFLTLLDVIDAADRAGALRPAPQPLPLPAGLTARLEAVQHHGQSYSPWVMVLALRFWSFLHGMTSLELYQHYSMILADRVDEFIRHEVEQFMHTLAPEVSPQPGKEE
jgi:AcrR family transcriptional regulator